MSGYSVQQGHSEGNPVEKKHYVGDILCCRNILRATQLKRNIMLGIFCAAGTF
jgi:hypothetical protein